MICGRMRGMVVGEGGRSSGVLLYTVLGGEDKQDELFVAWCGV